MKQLKWKIVRLKKKPMIKVSVLTVGSGLVYRQTYLWQNIASKRETTSSQRKLWPNSFKKSQEVLPNIAMGKYSVEKRISAMKQS